MSCKKDIQAKEITISVNEYNRLKLRSKFLNDWFETEIRGKCPKCGNLIRKGYVCLYCRYNGE